jgi:hypothetical protein
MWFPIHSILRRGLGGWEKSVEHTLHEKPWGRWIILFIPTGWYPPFLCMKNLVFLLECVGVLHLQNDIKINYAYLIWQEVLWGNVMQIKQALFCSQCCVCPACSNSTMAHKQRLLQEEAQGGQIFVRHSTEGATLERHYLSHSDAVLAIFQWASVC